MINNFLASKKIIILLKSSILMDYIKKYKSNNFIYHITVYNHSTCDTHIGYAHSYESATRIKESIIANIVSDLSTYKPHYNVFQTTTPDTSVVSAQTKGYIFNSSIFKLYTISIIKVQELNDANINLNKN